MIRLIKFLGALEPHPLGTVEIRQASSDQGSKMINIIWTTIKERKWGVIIYSVVSVLLLLLYISLYPSLEEQSQQLTEVMKSFSPELLKALGSSPEQLSNFTLEALLASKQFSAIFPFMAAILAIGIAGNDIAGEIENGTIQFILSQPISRLKFYFARYFANVILLTIFVAVSTVLTMPLASAYNVAYNGDIYPKLFLIAELFTIAVYSLGFLLSAIFSNKGRVVAIMAGVVTIMYIGFIVSVLKESLDKIKYISFFHYFSPDVLYSGNIDTISVCVFGSTIFLSIILGAIIFQKRDFATL